MPGATLNRICNIRTYRALPLVDLAARIADDGDKEALRELHDHRPLFRYAGHPQLRLGEYLTTLCHSQLARDSLSGNRAVLEEAYDLTVKKFSGLPAANEDPGTAGHSTDGRQGPDCRQYFSAFVKLATKELAKRPNARQLEREATAAVTLQRLVVRHFLLSCLECRRRSNRLIRRYFWNVNGGVMCLWLPSYMAGRQCRTWLETNIEDPDPARPLERERVQAVVDERLALPRLLSAGSLDGRGDLTCGSALRTPSAAAITVKGLARAVAEEKAENLDRQRPTIRKLGKQPLIGLILRIFDDLSIDQYNLTSVARSFGLNKATLSRFAGKDWISKARDGARVVIPDLWRNTAHTLAGHPDFVDAARAAGAWPMIESILIGTREEQ